MTAIPAIPVENCEIDPNAIRVLLTGFGPFYKFNENPSWLAVKPLHNTVLYTDPSVEQAVANAAPQQIHITALEIPVSYQAVLQTVPGFHARPPVLPDLGPDVPPPPPTGYDFMFHIGVAGRGPLRMEKLAHKNGYRMKDADGLYAPVVPLKEGPRDDTIPEGYESFPEEIHTDIDVAKLIHHLKESGIEQIYSSMDAGHYICDFVFYCSLAESRRGTTRQDKFVEKRATPSKTTPVLFMHCPPVDQPFTTEEVTDAIKKVVLWVCSRLHE
ncbi:peptidase C15 pyroglutamyl peptidase I-like protein [Wolfiporia cocos MD-104 SS10]|uniref:Peptidase C15 pyroglutamyl peptidase I-like protein n=1 Tax=Wolfiporia cocos (strain MD-104) TaxID=742152 RepID=A0A2H3JQ95_WOLCO|nr:peptidase C15 pyroglutamyl peptidase I-like protein [Wolfiporia cocos MD-104 SS10]